jgi:predicted RNA-binding protein with PUA-like domain
VHYWLIKSEPTSFGIDDLSRAPKRTTSWDGVRNYQARNMIRDDMRRGEQAFFYHSSCEIPGIAGIVEITKEGYPDPTAFERRHPHYDPDSARATPRWFMMDIRLVRKFERIITLDELRAHAAKELQGLVLLRPGNRLSVMPVTPAHWKFICSLE